MIEHTCHRADGFATYVGAIFGVVATVFTVGVVMPLLKSRIFAAADTADKCVHSPVAFFAP